MQPSHQRARTIRVSVAEQRRRNVLYYQSYALLVQISEEDGPIFSEVFDITLVDYWEMGDWIEGRLWQPTAFKHTVQLYQPHLKLTLTAIERTSNKYICLGEPFWMLFLHLS